MFSWLPSCGRKFVVVPKRPAHACRFRREHFILRIKNLIMKLACVHPMLSGEQSCPLFFLGGFPGTYFHNLIGFFVVVAEELIYVKPPLCSFMEWKMSCWKCHSCEHSGYRPFKRNLSQLKQFLNDSFRTSDTPELMIFLFPFSCLLPSINVPRPVIAQPRLLITQLTSTELAVHVNKSWESRGEAEWTSSRLKASEECWFEREAGSASSGKTKDEEEEEKEVAVEMVVVVGWWRENFKLSLEVKGLHAEAETRRLTGSACN